MILLLISILKMQGNHVNKLFIVPDFYKTAIILFHDYTTSLNLNHY